MRTRRVALLAAPAFWSVLVLAAPTSFDSFSQQQTLADDVTPGSSASRWRSFTDRIVEAIWPPPSERQSDGRKTQVGSLRPSRDGQQLPSHSLARYGGDIVLRFNISTAEEAESMAEAADTLLLDVWEFSKYWVDVRLAKDLVPSLLGLLPSSLQNSHTPLLFKRDLVKAISDTYPSPRDQQSTTQPNVPPSHIRDRPFSPSLNANGAETNIFFSDYQPFSVIQPWLRLLSSLFTTHVRLITIGASYQGRPISGLRVGVHPTNSEDPKPKKRKTVVMTGGLHAREWISTSTVNYVAYRLITGYGKNPRITKLLEDFDFVFIPTLNPDGYVYTWETDRLWRKNRQQTNVRFCPGIDLDRGFGYQWDGFSSSSSSTATGSNPCSESFPGDSPFEAIESRRLADWARNETANNNVEFIGFLDLHSYSQEILYPYSWTCEPRAPGQENLEELALGLEKTIRVSSGQIYEVMAACEGNVASSTATGGGTDSGKEGDKVMLPRIEDGGGSALDWFAHEMGVHYAYQIKLRDRGTYGFLLPRENIVPTGSEIWEAVMYFADFLGEVYVEGREGVRGVEMKKPEFEADASVVVAEEEEGVAVPEGGESSAEAFEEAIDTEVFVEDDEPWILVEDVFGEEFNQDLK